MSRTDDANATADQAVGTRSGVPTARLHVRFAADPASVPGARRFVVDGLHAWGLDELADDAALCISELAGNAALHSVSTFMRVEVWRSGDVVRMSVEDDGDEPLAVVVPRADYGPDGGSQSHELESEPTTGRGLAIVGFIASTWGVERTRDGKRIWAELGGDGAVDSCGRGDRRARRRGRSAAAGLGPGAARRVPGAAQPAAGRAPRRADA